MTTIKKFIADEKEMIGLGAELARHSKPGSIVYLEGNLGAGKTTLVRGFLRELGYLGKVKSPTYTLIEPYELGKLHLCHVDLYRLEGKEAFLHLGLSDYLTPDSICLIEWPEKAEDLLPKPSLHCKITLKGSGREVCLTGKNISKGINLIK